MNETVLSIKRQQLNRKICGDLCNIMNEIHGTNHSLKFWELIIENYVNTCLTFQEYMSQNTVDKKLLFEEINTQFFPSFKQQIFSKAIHFIKRVYYGNKSNLINKILTNSDQFTIGFPDMQIVKDELGESLPLYYPVSFGKEDIAARQKANELANLQKDLFFKNIIKQIPKIYVEYFKSIMKSIPLESPERKTIHVHILSSFYTKFIIAKYIDKSAKLYWYQHGCNSGETLTESEFPEHRLSDQFRTWGWKITDHDVPWKAYRLEKFKLEYDDVKSVRSFDCLLCYYSVYKDNIETLKSLSDLFFNKIDSKKYNRFLARPRPLNKIRSRKHELDFITDSRVTKDSGLSSMAKLVKESEVVIQFAIPSTNFLECIYVDHPTLGILWNDAPSDIVKPYYDFFYEKGILHKDFNSLIEHLNRVSVKEWWQDLMKHPMYQSFKNTFTRKV